MELERFGDRDILLTFQEAAQILRVSRATLYRLIGSGQLVGHKIGRGWRFYKADIHSFVAAQAGTRAQPNAPSATSTAGQAGERVDHHAA